MMSNIQEYPLDTIEIPAIGELSASNQLVTGVGRYTINKNNCFYKQYRRERMYRIIKTIITAVVIIVLVVVIILLKMRVV